MMRREPFDETAGVEVAVAPDRIPDVPSSMRLLIAERIKPVIAAETLCSVERPAR